MKISAFATLFAVLIVFSACKKEDDENQNIKKYYQGNWEMESDQTGLDTTFAIGINAEGKFSYTLEYNGISGNLNGQVNNEGNVSGTIMSFGINAGSISGKLNTNGTGSGNYYLISNDTIGWAATRQ